MNTLIAPTFIALASSSFSMHAIAQMDHSSHGGPATMQMGIADAPLTEGIVKRIDKSEGRVTLSHGLQPRCMPTMTMAYRIKKAGWIDKTKEGQRILFAAEQVDGTMTLTRLELTK